jgi:hypothetical protein
MPRSGFRATKPGPEILAGVQGPRLLPPGRLSRALLPTVLHNAQFSPPALRVVVRSSLPTGGLNSRYAKPWGPWQGARQPAWRGHAARIALASTCKQAARALSPGGLRAPSGPAPA